MNLRGVIRHLLHKGRSYLVFALPLLPGSLSAAAPPPPAQPELHPSLPAPTADAPPTFSLDAAIAWALQHNPEIAAFRQQRGIAAAGVVIARTYPFNPIFEGRARPDFGPASAGVTNSVNQEERLSLELEVRGQGNFRREAALAALTRTEWEIAAQELGLAVRVARAFDTVVYRYRKLKLIQDTIELNTRAAAQVKELVDNGRLTTADLIVIRTELADARAQVGIGNAALMAAWQDLYRALGVTAGSFDLSGGFEVPDLGDRNPDLLMQSALERRPDLRARQIAVAEADARLKLEIANRYGNPVVGPDYEMNETRAQFIGVQISLPFAVLNTHRGEIQQRTAERGQAELGVRQTEVNVRQDVRAALVRLAYARQWLDSYRSDLLPTLEKALKDIRTLFEARAPGADLLRLIDVQRKLLHARDSELDAIYEVRQALADLAAAVGDPLLGVLPCPKP
jgi:cobalt-zinc-cadmium efflux system outer membrane protein